MSESGPVHADEPVENPVIEIASLNGRGAGVAKLGERRLEIDAALPGERVRIERPRRRRRRVEAASVEVLEASADRVVARCPHFGLCGGCALQHMGHEAQLRLKQHQLIATLAGQGLAPGRVRLPVSAPPWGYRRKARLGAKLVPAKGGVLVGFRERNAPYVAVLDGCEVLVAAVGRRIGALRALLGALDARAAIPQIEVAAGDDGVTLVLRHLEALGEADLERLAAFSAETGIDLGLQSGGPETVTALDGGAPRARRYALPEFGVELEFGPMDFVQVNAGVNRALVSAAVAALAPRGDERVLDLFCGLGNFTLPLATRAGSVHGIEGAAALVERARANARRNALDNVTFEVADLYAEPAPALGEGYDAVLLDPPRSGAGPLVDALARLDAPCIVYVSCNPETLASDLARLVSAHGYRLAEAGVIDMFPHTMHVESIAVLERA